MVLLVDQVGQLHSREKAYEIRKLAIFANFFRSLGGTSKTCPPTRKPACQIEVGQVGQLQTRTKAYENRNLANFAKFFRSLGGTSKTCPTLRGSRPARSKLVKLANFKPAQKPMKIGTWPTLPSFSEVSVGLRRLVPPYEEAGLPDRSWSSWPTSNPHKSL